MDQYSRRIFLSRLVTGTGVALAFSAIPNLAAAHDHVAKNKNGERKFSALTAEEAKELEAVCERIIPSDEDGPGAREAGAIYFIDYILTHYQPELQPRIRKALADYAREASPKRFSELSAEQQIEILKKHEKTDEFEDIRNYTILGFLGDPSYGGNRDDMGWKYIGFENPGMFFPPFGYYDDELLKANKKEGE